MRIVIMGTGPFAVPSCERLLQHGDEIVLVIVRPPVADKKAPRSPVEEWAERAKLPMYQPASVNSEEAIERLRAARADLFFVCDYGQILSRACLGIARLGGINLHGSLLPRHRGAAPVQWTLLVGDRQAGVSVIHMTPGLDAGPVLAVRKTDVGRDENAEQLEARLAVLGSEATLEAVERLGEWGGSSPIGLEQDKSQATKAPRLSKADGRLRFELPAVELERRVRGYQPWPGAYADLYFSDSKQLSIHLRAARALPSPDRSEERPVSAAWVATAAELGLVGEEWSAPWDQLLVVQTGQGWLLVSTVQPAGKRVMTTSEFVRGHPLSAAARFVLPK